MIQIVKNTYPSILNLMISIVKHKMVLFIGKSYYYNRVYTKLSVISNYNSDMPFSMSKYHWCLLGFSKLFSDVLVELKN